MRRIRSPYTLLCKTALVLLFSHSGSIQAATPTLRDAVEAAWAKQPESRAMYVRQEEMAARRDAASSFFAGPPSIELSQRTDRFDQNSGDKETEAAIAVPIWAPGTRSAAQRLATVESTSLEVKNRAAKLNVAGEVREAYWQARFAENDYVLSVRRSKDAAALVQDIERRFKVGDLARTDFNQAQGNERLAKANLAEAQARLHRAQHVFRALTGMNQLPEVPETLVATDNLPSPHPKLSFLQAAVEVQKARLGQASADRREPPEVTLGMRRERPGYGAEYESSVVLGIRIPLATQSRNAPRIAAANAELMEVEAALALEQARIQAEIDSAQEELAQAENIAYLAQQRFQLAAETLSLHAKAFQLGELDLQSRLRSENERYEAELSLFRARLEVSRAISRVNQSLGLLP